ncbi:DUF1707 SHOCT-like domain-containing protein [Parenemella sanctibonifatiensis]|uniref:DUF1707 domain-containing protein n=1 Tax=Parenemella sanctibonifatiensis TaxID=2016505 RepID=A0A255EIB8_9ACTN|nr:DUF1707 domain-containing protein [Parenemella sanctibonifatiensis]OYN91278.1 hypothetical protein CGZ91_07480 [Parenemella sanctibonifatiensis]
MADAAQMRIGHAERDRVVEVLQKAAAEGRITMEEQAERVEKALAAKVYADLDPLVADLPVPPPSAMQEPRTRTAQLSPLTEPGYSLDDPLVIRAGWDSEKRDGVWTLPPFLRLDGGMGEIKLNCLRAQASADVIDLEVEGVMGSITIVVPEGWAANLDRLNKSWGSVTNKAAHTPQPGCPILVAHGKMGMGSFTIRGAGWFERNALAKALKESGDAPHQLEA